MAIKKKKISELPLVQSPVGLFSIGVDAQNKSVKFSVEGLTSTMIWEEIGKVNISIEPRHI